MSDQSNQSEWTSCPEGTLTSLGSRLHEQQRREQTASLLKTAAACCVLLVAAVGIVWGVTSANVPVAITCAKCHDNFDEYHAHLTANQPINNVLASSMQAHLAKCPKCRSLFDEQFPDVLTDVLQDAGYLLARSNRYNDAFLLASF